MKTCTWAPTVFQGTQIVDKRRAPAAPTGDLPTDPAQVTVDLVQSYEALGLTHLLIAQRWWGSGEDIEGSSLDCLAMTSLFASCTRNMILVTAIHPGFFMPTAIAKWGATLDRLTQGRWAINVTSGWNLEEFDMYGVDAMTHDRRYARSAEFIEVLRGAWAQTPFTYSGEFYQAQALRLEPRPAFPLVVFQGGQSAAAIDMASRYSDWMFLNGGTPERIATVIDKVRKACRQSGREVKFAMYAAPLCRATDAQAWEEIDQRLARVDPGLVARRQDRLAKGAEGMWSAGEDPLSVLDTNEGYVPQLIGAPETVMRRIDVYRQLGIEMLHLDVRDALFRSEVLPHLSAL